VELLIGWSIQALFMVVGAMAFTEEFFERKFSWYLKVMIFVIFRVESFIFPIVGQLSIIFTIITWTGLLFWQTKKIVVNLIAIILTVLLSVVSSYLAQVVVLEIIFRIIGTIEGVGYMVLLQTITFIFVVTSATMLRKPYKNFLSSELLTSELLKWVLGFLVLTFIVFYTDILVGAYLGFSVYVLLLRGIQLLLYLLLMLGIFYKLHTMYKKDKQNEIERMQAEQQREYLSHLETLYEEMRGLHHDYRNLLFGFEGYLESGDLDGARAYHASNIQRVSSALQKADFGKSQLKNIGIPAVKGLLTAQVMNAKARGVDVKIECPEPIDGVRMDALDLCKCLGIFLDNAIEESLHLNDPEVTVAFMTGAEDLWIVVRNNCRDKLPTVKQMFKRGFSSKGEGRGLGLDNVAQIVKRTPNVQMETEIDTQKFTQHLRIYT